MCNNRSFVFYPQIGKSTKAERFGGWTMLPLFPSIHLHNCRERSFLPQVRHTHTHRPTSHAPVLYVVIASGRPQRLGAANKDRGPCQTWTNMANIFCLQSSGAELETTPKVWELGTSGPRHNRVLREEKKYSSLQNFCTEYLHLNIQSKTELRWLPIILIRQLRRNNQATYMYNSKGNCR